MTRTARRLERKRQARRRWVLRALAVLVVALGALWWMWNASTPEARVVRPPNATNKPTWDPKGACADVKGEGGAYLVTRKAPSAIGSTGINAQVGAGANNAPPPWKLTLSTPGGLKRNLSASPGDMIIWQGRAMEMISGCASQVVLRPSSVVGVTDPTATQ